MKKQTGNVALWLVIGVGTIALAVIILWRYNEAHQIAYTPTDAEIKQVKAQPDYNGERISSGKKAYSLYVPRGWVGTGVYADDTIKFSGVEYDTTQETSVTFSDVAPQIAPGSESDVVPSPLTITSGTSESIAAPEGDKTKLNIVADGVKATVYVKQYKAGDWLQVASADGSERRYTYEFVTQGKKTQVIYFVNTGEADRHGFIEKVVRTLQFGEKL